MTTPVRHFRRRQARPAAPLLALLLVAALTLLAAAASGAAAAAAAAAAISPAHSGSSSSSKYSHSRCGVGCSRCSRAPKSKAKAKAKSSTTTCLACRSPNFTLVKGTGACVCSPGFAGSTCRACPLSATGSSSSSSTSLSLSCGSDVFAQGVASGGPTGTSAFLWTRAWTTSPVSVAVVPAENEDEFAEGDCSSDAAAPHVAFAEALGVPDPGRNYTMQIEAVGLSNGQRYTFRFCVLGNGDASAAKLPSIKGTFRTARRDNDNAAVSFAFSGDFTAQVRKGQTQPAYLEGFDVFQSMAQLGDALEFTVLGGDVIYSDDVVNDRSARLPVAATREQKWQMYLNNLAMPQLRAEHAKHAVLTHWDDHEWDNGFYRNASDPDAVKLWEAGLQAFFDFAPMAPYGGGGGVGGGRGLGGDDNSNDNNDNNNNNPGIFSARSWGPNLDVIVLDETSFRTQPVDEAYDQLPRRERRNHPCHNPYGDNRADGSIDRMPTAPQALRDQLFVQLGSVDTWLTQPVSPQCLELLNAPGRTILGAAQMAALEAALDASWERGARWRVVVTTNPVQEILVSPYGRFEGYPQERSALLALLAKHPNTVTLATDVHATLAGATGATWGEPQPNGGQPSGSFPYEVAVGPVAAGTRSVIWSRYFLGGADAVDALVRQLYLAAPVYDPAKAGGLGKQCANLNAYSFAVVTAGTDALTVQPMDRLGVALQNADGTPCGPIVVERVGGGGG